MYNSVDFIHFDLFHSSLGCVGIDSVFQQNYIYHLMNKIIRFEFKPKFELLPDKHSSYLSTQLHVYLLGKLIINDIVFEYTTDGPYLMNWKLTGGPLDFINMRMISTIVPKPGRKFCYTTITYCKDSYLARIISVLIMRFEATQVVSIRSHT